MNTAQFHRIRLLEVVVVVVVDDERGWSGWNWLKGWE